MDTDRRYTGQRWEASLGLYDYRARFYSPGLGRFVSADTVVPGAGNPQALNRYAYVLNSPLKYTDPSGHKACGPWGCGYENPAHYLGKLDEARLAKYQQNQGPTNNCAAYALASAFNILYGGQVQGRDVAEYANLSWVRYPFRYRTFPGLAITPQQQANLANDIAEKAGLSLSAVSSKGTTDDLIRLLDQRGTVVLVTIGWSDDAPRPILATDDETGNYRQLPDGGVWGRLGLNGHTLLIAAYDPGHLDPDGHVAPWGFINSWIERGDKIYWMTEHDFNLTWGHNIPGIGANNMVIVTVQPNPAGLTCQNRTNQ